MKRAIVGLLVVLAVVAVDAQTPQGTVGVAWDAVAGAASYKVCIGTAAGTYPSCDTVPGTQTAHTFAALTDCRNYYAAVKAVDADGDESESWSNEVVGWPQPRIVSVAPALVEQGRTVEVAITGANFAPDAAVSVTWNGLTATTLGVDSCTQIRARFNTVPTVQTGNPEIVVKIGPPDGQGKRVAGSATGRFQITGVVRPPVVPGVRRSEAR